MKGALLTAAAWVFLLVSPGRSQEPAPAPDDPPAPSGPASPPSAQGGAEALQSDQSALEEAVAHDAEESAEAELEKEERCAQLLAQGQIALAQAENCGGDDGPSFVGSLVSFTQTTAPLSRTLPDNDNAFYAVSFYLAPRLSLSKDWAVSADVTLASELTRPDDTSERFKWWSTDTRITALGNLGSLGGFTFTGGPRLVVPTSEPSWAADLYLGTGAVMSVVRSVDALAGLSFSVGGSFVHMFSGNLTREVREGTAPRCMSAGAAESGTDCSAGQTRVVQDASRAFGSFSLNFTRELNLSVNYFYSWNLVKAFAGSVSVPTLGGPAPVEGETLPGTRVRRRGDLFLALSYQPVGWLIATLQATTSVCYDQAFGGQSALGGCAGGLKASDFWLRNPLVNKFSTLALQLTVPVDAFVRALRGRGEPEAPR